MTINQALLSLEGLSVGDAFGECFFYSPREMITNRTLPPGLWYWTDDTHMAISIVEVLREYGYIHQDALAQAFTKRFAKDPRRGYGSGAIHLLRRLSRGEDWRAVAPTLFQGGSFGNGGAMRAAPIGGYYAGDPVRAAHEGRRSAEITHTHPEGQAGAMAVAAAAAIAAQHDHPIGTAFLHAVLPFVPASLVQSGIEQAIDIPPAAHDRAIQQLGTGQGISAQDTVPYCLWCVAHHLDDYESAIWVTVAGLGDRDTTCAIVGGIVALSAGQVPLKWVQLREPLPLGIDWGEY
jgi:ADP-ribosylglycohydrolase